MKRNILHKIGAALLLVLIGSTPALAANDLPGPHGSISLGAEYASGRYGTDATVRSVYLPLIVTWLPTNRFDLSLEIPYLFQSSDQVTTDLYRNGQGTVTRVPVGRGGYGRNRSAAQPSQPEAEIAASSAASGSDVSGLGDLILRLGFIALPEGAHTPQLRPSLFVKIPTARAEDGLGTGEFDGGLGLGASKWVGNLQLAGEGFYNYQGKAEGFGLRNYVSWTAQAGYLLTENLEPFLVVKGATAPAASSGNLLEGRVRILWSFAAATVLDLYLARGLTDSSPDYGAGLAVCYSF